MNAQLIYATEDARALAWAKDSTAAGEKVRRELDLFDARVQAAYPTEEGQPRPLAYFDGLVVGIARLDAEPTPDGWSIHDEWGVFVPDPETIAGAPWQAAIDQLPSTDWFHPEEIGIPANVSMNLGGMTSWMDAMHLVTSRDGTRLFSLWHDRDIKPWLDGIFTTNPMGWKEIPRSQWYALLEAAEDDSGRP